jgi:hypothetical protein
MIKWTFFFDEGNVSTVVNSEEEDLRISEWADSPTEFLHIPNSKFDMYVNPSMVKAFVREMIEQEEIPQLETPVAE